MEACEGEGECVAVVAAGGGARMTTSMTRRWALALVMIAVAGCSRGEKKEVVVEEKELPGPTRHFASPEAAATALIDASAKFDDDELIAILGEVGRPLVNSEDVTRDSTHAVEFAAEARAAHHITLDSTGKVATLSVGKDDWPVPMPIVESGGQWTFDSKAGVHEVLLRRIGANEFDAIRVCRGFVEAQEEYARARYDGKLINQYAQKIVSTPGKRDGLAWRTADGKWEGPVGENIARAIEEGYSDKRKPFHGYYYKVLKSQGPNAKNGAVDFVINGAMIGGFGLVASPAEYGVTGVKSFIVNQDGVVYEQDLGDSTEDVFRSMESFDPDSTWQPVAD